MPILVRHGRTWIQQQLRLDRFLWSVLVIALPAVAQAQFSYTTYNGTITITGYTGPGGAVEVPGSINGLPVSSIGDAAFIGVTTLTRVTVPNSVARIGDSAFGFCYGLTNITIPPGLIDIGSYAFDTCYSLAGIVIPNTVTTIGDGAFISCSNLSNITISYSVTKIGDSLFFNCISLTNVTIPYSVTNIGNSGFANCTSLSNVQIPGSVVSIGGTACSGCTSLIDVMIPNAVYSIGDNAFYGCTNLNSITVDPLNPTYSSSADGVLFNKTQTTLLLYPGAKAGSYTVPTGVTNIANSAFISCIGLTNLTIPVNVTNLGSASLASCPSLLTISVDPNNAVFSSLNVVLFNKNQSTLIQYPGGKPGDYALPASCGSIGAGAFSGCQSLTNITLPNNILNI